MVLDEKLEEKIKKYQNNIFAEHAIYEQESVPWGDTDASYDVCVNEDELSKIIEDELSNDFERLEDEYQFLSVLKEDEPELWELEKQEFIKIAKKLL